MTGPFASGKHAFGMCDICDIRCEYPLLKAVFRAGIETGLLACPDCWDPDHPQNWTGRFEFFDPQALERARPDKGLAASRAINDTANARSSPLAISGGKVTVITT